MKNELDLASFVRSLIPAMESISLAGASAQRCANQLIFDLANSTGGDFSDRETIRANNDAASLIIALRALANDVNKLATDLETVEIVAK